MIVRHGTGPAGTQGLVFFGVLISVANLTDLKMGTAIWTRLILTLGFCAIAAILLRRSRGNLQQELPAP